MKVKPAGRTGEVLLEVNGRDETLLAAAATTPFTVKNVLVPIDFSDCSKKALRYALPLARQHGATVTLLYVTPTLPYAVGEYGSVDFAPIETEMRSTAQKRLAALAEEEVRGGPPAQQTVRSGSPAAEIVAAAKELPADIIVISTHGHTGLKHVFLGSVAEHVVRYAPCPVLVVREREHEFLAS